MQRQDAGPDAGPDALIRTNLETIVSAAKPYPCTINNPTLPLPPGGDGVGWIGIFAALVVSDKRPKQRTCC
jgi:hypothetical protein